MSRTVLVTGGGRGLGRAISVAFAAAGERVVVMGRTAAACDEVVAAIADAGGTALAAPGDVSVAADRARVVDAAVAAFGGIDVLVNNAGILKPRRTAKLTEEELDEVLAVNLKGPLFLSQLVLPHFERAGGGVIVNISALGAFQPMSPLGAYCAVKAAMVNWTTTMAHEWAPLGVRVNGLVPGPIATDMILPVDRAQRDAFVAEMGANTLLGRLAEPEELVGGVLFLAGPESAWMTGRSLFFDGGMLK